MKKINEKVFDNFEEFLNYCTKIEANNIDFEVHEIKHWVPSQEEWRVFKYKVVWCEDVKDC